jgi:hypothetical protein
MKVEDVLEEALRVVVNEHKYDLFLQPIFWHLLV